MKLRIFFIWISGFNAGIAAMLSIYAVLGSSWLMPAIAVNLGLSACAAMVSTRWPLASRPSQDRP